MIFLSRTAQVYQILTSFHYCYHKCSLSFISICHHIARSTFLPFYRYWELLVILFQLLLSTIFINISELPFSSLFPIFPNIAYMISHIADKTLSFFLVNILVYYLLLLYMALLSAFILPPCYFLYNFLNLLIMIYLKNQEQFHILHNYLKY